MAVRPFQPSDLPILLSLYTELASHAGHGFPPTEEEFCLAFAQPPAHLRRSIVLVAEESGKVRGFARCGISRQVDNRWTLTRAGDGQLFGPFITGQEEAAGVGLLSSVSTYLKEGGATRILAFDPVEGVGAPFHNGGWAGLSERMPHIAGLLTRAGFRVRHRELCLTRLAMPIPDISPPARFSLAFEARENGRCAVRAFDGGTYAGGCFSSRIYPTRSARREASDWGYIDGLGVQEPYQGRGLGRALLTEMIRKLDEAGCTSICLTTNADNHRAQNLYYSLGFAVVDSCITLIRNTP
jgi:ribosomal protein S18 acetylase RimI-like enzyme